MPFPPATFVVQDTAKHRKDLNCCAEAETDNATPQFSMTLACGVHKLNAPFISTCECRSSVVWNSLYGSGIRGSLCSHCVQMVPALTKEAFRSSPARELSDLCVVLPPNLDDEWCRLLQCKPPIHVFGSGHAAEPPLPPMATFVTWLNANVASWIGRTQQSSLIAFASLGSTDDAMLHDLRVLLHLRYLDLNNSSLITDAGLAHLTTLLNLEMLDLSSCNLITDAGLAHLTTLVNLHTLDLRWCKQITDAALAHLTALTKLQTLNLKYCRQITDAGVARVGFVKSLETHFTSSRTSEMLESR